MTSASASSTSTCSTNAGGAHRPVSLDFFSMQVVVSFIESLVSDDDDDDLLHILSKNECQTLVCLMSGFVIE